MDILHGQGLVVYFSDDDWDSKKLKRLSDQHDFFFGRVDEYIETYKMNGLEVGLLVKARHLWVCFSK